MYTDEYITNYDVDNETIKSHYNAKIYKLHGTNLQPPYGEDDILLLEKILDMQLPMYIRDYLSHVSREIIVGNEPIVFEVDENLGECQIPNNSQVFTEGDCPIHGHKRCSDKKCPQVGTQNMCNFVYRRKRVYLCHCSDVGMLEGMVQIGSTETNFGEENDYLVLKTKNHENATHQGTIWRTKANGKIYKTSPNFAHYIKSSLI